ncbi:hypothetical protein, partial [Amycolatopsis acidiphila]
MPSSNPGRPQQPMRRPKVAGLRRPSPSPRPQDERPQDEPPQDVEAPETEENLFAAPSKPSPRRKSRDAGTAKPSDFEEAEAALSDADAESDPEPRAERRRRNPYIVAGALFGLAIVLAGFATWFKIEDNKVSAATENTALLDVAGTSQVNQAATSAAETLFSYDYNNIAKTQNAAKDLLLNDEVKATYNNLMGEVERLAPQQKIVVTVKASRSAVIMLNGDRARVMVFVDQTATRTDQNQTSSGSAQLWLNMQKVDGKWKVAQLNTYNSE